MGMLCMAQISNRNLKCPRENLQSFPGIAYGFWFWFQYVAATKVEITPWCASLSILYRNRGATLFLIHVESYKTKEQNPAQAMWGEGCPGSSGKSEFQNQDCQTKTLPFTGSAGKCRVGSDELILFPLLFSTSSSCLISPQQAHKSVGILIQSPNNKGTQ